MNRSRKNSGPRREPRRLRLVDTDLRLLKWLYLFGYMSTHQITQARYLTESTRANLMAQQRSVQRRLLQLVEAGILRRIEQPIFRSERSGSKPYLYALGPAGADLLVADYEIDRRDLTWQPSLAERNFSFMTHILSIVDFWHALRRSCHQHGVVLESFVPDRLLRRDPVKVLIGGDTGVEKTVSVVPDAFYTFRQPTTGKVGRCFLELDRGTVTITPRFWDRRGHQRKVKTYLALAEDAKLYEQFEATALWVIFVTTTEQRLATLVAATEAVGGDHRFWFTTLDQLTADIIGAPVWQVAGKEGERHKIL